MFETMNARLEQAVNVLSVLKPWWGVYLAKMEFIEFDAGTDMNGDYTSMCWLSDDMQMYYDRSWINSAKIMDIAVDLERQIQYKIRGGKSRLVMLSEGQREELLGVSMAMEVSSSMNADYTSMMESGSLENAIMLTGNVDAESLSSSMRSLGETWPEFDREVFLPSEFGFPEELSAEDYADLILSSREDDPEEDQVDKSSGGDEGGGSGEDEKEWSSLSEESNSDEQGDGDGERAEKTRNGTSDSDGESEDAENKPDDRGEPGDTRDESTKERAGDEPDAGDDGDTEECSENGSGSTDGTNTEATGEREESGDGDPEGSESDSSEPESGSGMTEDEDGGGEAGEGEPSSFGDEPDDKEEAESDVGDEPDNEESLFEVVEEGVDGIESIGGSSGDQGDSRSEDFSPQEGGEPGSSSAADLVNDQINSSPRSSWMARGELDSEVPVGAEDKEDGGLDAREIQELEKDFAYEVLNARDQVATGQRALDGASDTLVNWAGYIARRTGVNWQNQFSEITNDTVTAVKSMGMTDLSIQKRNPNQPQIGPIMLGLEGYDPKGFILVDVSGSMEPFLSLVLDSVSEIVESAFASTSVPLTWVAADTGVVDVGETRTPESVYKSVRRFGGGTNFAHVIEDLVDGSLSWNGEILPSPDILFIISDGQFDWPWKEEQEPPMGTQIVFVQTGGMNESDMRKWGIPAWATSKMVVVAASDDSAI